jgi:hypothetical protein
MKSQNGVLFLVTVGISIFSDSLANVGRMGVACLLGGVHPWSHKHRVVNGQVLTALCSQGS